MTEVRVSADACFYLHDLLSVARAVHDRDVVPGHLMLYKVNDTALLLRQGCRANGLVINGRRWEFVEPLYWLARFAALHGPLERRAEMAKIALVVGVIVGISAVELMTVLDVS